MGEQIKPDAIITIHPFKVQVGVFDTFGGFNSYWSTALNLIPPNEPMTEAMAITDMTCDGCPWFALVIPKGIPLATVAHECSHMVDFIFDKFELQTDVSNTELRAYMLEYIINEVMEVESK